MANETSTKTASGLVKTSICETAETPETNDDGTKSTAPIVTDNTTGIIDPTLPISTEAKRPSKKRCLVCNGRCSAFRVECDLHHVQAIHKRCAKHRVDLSCNTCHTPIVFIVPYDVVDCFQIKRAKSKYQASQTRWKRVQREDEIHTLTIQRALSEGAAHYDADQKLIIDNPKQYKTIRNQAKQAVTIRSI